MSIAGTTPITAPVAPSSAADVYPSHIAEYGKGGSSLNTSGSQSGTHTATTYGAACTLFPTFDENTVVLTAPLTSYGTL